jgi:hypothetical protein
MHLRCENKVDVTDASMLTDLDQAQLREAGKRYDGNDLPAEARIGPEDDEESGALFRITRWSIVSEDGATRYDAWFYQVDSGTIFAGGTTDVVAEIVQFGLECTDATVRAAIHPALRAAGLLRN